MSSGGVSRFDAVSSGVRVSDGRLGRLRRTAGPVRVAVGPCPQTAHRLLRDALDCRQQLAAGQCGAARERVLVQAEQRRERGRILEVLNRQPVQSRRQVAGAAVPVINKLPCDA